jgi:hypothetical protein
MCAAEQGPWTRRLRSGTPWVLPRYGAGSPGFWTLGLPGRTGSLAAEANTEMGEVVGLVPPRPAHKITSVARADHGAA